MVALSVATVARSLSNLIPMTELSYRHVEVRESAKIHKGFDAIAHNIVGRFKRRKKNFEELVNLAEAVEAEADRFKELKNEALKEELRKFRELFRRKKAKVDDEELAIALAAVREAAARKTGLRPYKEQLIGALALHKGYLAEMATGEGKTLTASLAAILNGWSGLPCHVITVNDYLAERDAKWFKELFSFCKVTVGYVVGEMEPHERKRNYNHDVVYTTSKEICADFLRDRIQLMMVKESTRCVLRKLLSPSGSHADRLTMRGMHTAIIDEADSVLIDEAVTPLIISRQNDNEFQHGAAESARKIAQNLELDTHYTIDPLYKEVTLLDSADEVMDEVLETIPVQWRNLARRHEIVKQAISAKEFFHLGKQYIIKDGKIVIVDESTGRPMPMRSWGEGLHQAIEAKENVELTPPNETIARMSFQRFFRLFKRLSGMSGTAKEGAGEFWKIYQLPVMQIPTHKPCIRAHLPEQVFKTQEDKWSAILDEIIKVHATERPILIGTRTIQASEHLAGLLKERGMAFNLLNATNTKDEASIVANAGHRGLITIATNMAGRGTDIKLSKDVAELGGLHVIATERHESQRVDRQLFGRAGRQGDPGSCISFVSLEDELYQRFSPAPVRWLVDRVSTDLIPERISKIVMTACQYASQHIAFKQRCSVLRKDNWLDEALSFAGSSYQ